MPRFVVHEHQQPQHHFDLRLERDGVLRCWAVPRGVPTGGERRLAVAVPDHDLADLTADTPQRSIWDAGEYTEHEFGPDRVIVTFLGRRLQASYALIHTGGDQWLLRRVRPRQ
jgi:hypothetical protein